MLITLIWPAVLILALPQVRRDTSGCKPVFDLIEYAMDIDLPEHVVRHPIVQALNQGANDLVTVSSVYHSQRYGMSLTTRFECTVE